MGCPIYIYTVCPLVFGFTISYSLDKTYSKFHRCKFCCLLFVLALKGCMFITSLAGDNLNYQCVNFIFLADTEELQKVQILIVLLFQEQAIQTAIILPANMSHITKRQYDKKPFHHFISLPLLSYTFIILWFLQILKFIHCGCLYFSFLLERLFCLYFGFWF